jgi:hypothetical protein
MNVLNPEMTVAEALSSLDPSVDERLRYVIEVYGRDRIGDLLSGIRNTGNVDCGNYHEYLLGTLPFPQCPHRKRNNRCSHQTWEVTDEVAQEPSDALPIIQLFPRRMYDAGLYILHTHGREVRLQDGKIVTHAELNRLMVEFAKVDQPAYEEYTRFNGHDITQGGKKPSLAERDDRRDPQLKSVLSLSVLKQQINACKRPFGPEIDAIRDAIAAELARCAGA